MSISSAFPFRPRPWRGRRFSGRWRRRWLLLTTGAVLTAALQSPAGHAAPKVVVISLDGATPRLVNQYLADGTLSADQGLGLLRQQGVYAEQNLTVSPSLTAAGHVAIATGSTAARNDVVANTFHLTASPFLLTISGFGAPIGGYQINPPPNPPTMTPDPTAEPIWVALRAAGKKVVCATFPGADGVDVRVPGATANIVQPAAERTVDYTVPFGEFGGVSAKGFTATAANFGPAPAGTVAQLQAADVSYYGTPLQFNGTVSVNGQTSQGLDTFYLDDGAGGPRVYYVIQCVALDTTNDGVTNYDTLVFFNFNYVTNTGEGIQPGPFALPSTGPVYVKPGGPSQRFYCEGSPRKAGCSFYVSALAGDLSTVRVARYSVNDIPRNVPPAVLANVDDINNHVGYWGDAPDFRITERLTASFAPFSDAELEAIYEDQVVTWADYQTRVGLRAIEANPNADLVMIYSEQPDGSEHQFLLVDPRQASSPTDPATIGAGQDPAKVARYAGYVRRAYQVADDLVQRTVAAVGTDAGGRPRGNVLVVSDHGFDPFHTAVNLNAVLANAGLPASKVRAVTSGPAANVYVNLQGREAGVGGTPVGPAEFAVLQEQIVRALQSLTDANPNYTAGVPGVPVFDKVYARPLPADLNDPTFGHGVGPFVGQDSGDVYALLTPGYNFDGTQSPVVPRLGDLASSTPTLSVPNFYGAHGYDPTRPNMSAIFFAAGPDVTPSAQPLAQVRNIDVAPTVARLLGVTPSPLVQGRALPLGPVPLQLLAVASRKVHGGAGAFDVPLPRGGAAPRGKVGVEPRRAGAGDTHTLVFTFSNPLTAGGARVTSGNGSVANTGVAGRELTVDLANVADAQTLVVTLQGVSDGTTTAFPPVAVPVAFLLGDVTGGGGSGGNRVVDAADVNQVRAEAATGGAVNAANFRADLNASGVINAGDVVLTRANLGHSLAPAAP